MSRALLFPGQGSQQVGMGRELAEAFPSARELFEQVDHALGKHLSRIMFQGPDKDLRLTENAQPAIMAVSLAVVRVLEHEGGTKLSRLASFVAGHSLGEYSALSAAGALTVDECARVLRQRGRAMQEAVAVGKGAMAAVLGAEQEQVQGLIHQGRQPGQCCVIANDNAPGQLVISGQHESVECVVQLARSQKIKVVVLPVSAPFHCQLMEPAARVMSRVLEKVDFARPQMAWVSNVTASSVTSVDLIPKLLVEQTTAKVRWRESMKFLIEQGVTSVIELGSGRVLGNLARRIDQDLEVLSVHTPGEVEGLLKTL